MSPTTLWEPVEGFYITWYFLFALAFFLFIEVYKRSEWGQRLLTFSWDHNVSMIVLFVQWGLVGHFGVSSWEGIGSVTLLGISSLAFLWTTGLHIHHNYNDDQVTRVFLNLPQTNLGLCGVWAGCLSAIVDLIALIRHGSTLSTWLALALDLFGFFWTMYCQIVVGKSAKVIPRKTEKQH